MRIVTDTEKERKKELEGMRESVLCVRVCGGEKEMEVRSNERERVCQKNEWSRF